MLQCRSTLMLAALSGIVGMAGFLAALMLRIRSWASFGVRGTTLGWLAIGVGVGAAAFVAKGLAVLCYIWLTGDASGSQDAFARGSGGGILTVIAATFLIGVLTPIGEELLFRGVVTNALLRYGPTPAVAGSALVFALFHGISVVFPAALVAGIATGEVFRRSGSIWPAMMVHVVMNLPTIPIMVLTEGSRWSKASLAFHGAVQHG